MNKALTFTDSEAIAVKEDRETITEKDPFHSFPGLSRQRIDSFFKEPSLEPDDPKAQTPGKSDGLDSQPLPLKKKAPIAFLPKRPYHPRTFSSLQRWEGYVIEILDEYFIARITDLDDEHEDEEIEVMFSEISEDDQELIRPGAIFNWHIGYEMERGTVKRSSIIRFRRMPKWTESDKEKAESFEKELKHFLNGF